MPDSKMKPLSLDRALTTLRGQERTLRAQGVRHASIFGSVARGEALADSDVDVMVELDPDACVSLFEFVALQLELNKLLGTPVDLVERQALKPAARRQADAEKIDAF